MSVGVSGLPPRWFVKSMRLDGVDVTDKEFVLPPAGQRRLDVTLSDRVGRLSGTVTDRAHKFEAEHIADGVRGVTEVTNQLRVQAAGSSDHGARTERGEATDRATGSGNGNGNGKESKAKSARAH